MTRDEAKKILGEGATEEQVTNLLNNYHEKEKESKSKIAELEGKLTKVSDYETIKARLDEYDKAKMTEQEKIEADKKQAAETLRKAQQVLNNAKAKEILAGVTVNDKILERMTTGTLEETIELATAYKQSIDDFKSDTEKKVRESLTNVDLKPSITNVNQNDDVMTFDKFSKMSAVEQEKFIAEHPEEFEKL